MNNQQLINIDINYINIYCCIFQTSKGFDSFRDNDGGGSGFFISSFSFDKRL